MTNLDGILEQIVNGAARIMESRRCSIWLPTADGGLVCRAAVGDESYASRVGQLVPPEVVEQFADRDAPFVTTLDEVDQIGRAVRLEEMLVPHAVSFIQLDQGLAALAVAVESSIGTRELELLGGIASQARLAITNAWSFATLERTFLSTVEALANALEAKDSYTSSHARWICDMAIEVGRELGLDADELEARRARRAVPRHRQDRHPRLDPDEARSADRGGARADRAPPGARGADSRPHRAARGGPGRSSGRATSATTVAATPTGWLRTTSRSRRASSSPATPSTR